MRPVRSAYRFWAAVSCADDAFGKFVPLNIARAGSLATTSKLTDGSSVWVLFQSVYCVQENPVVKLWRPLSHVTVSSIRSVVALRDDCCVGVFELLPGDCSVEPTEGNVRLMPFM